MSYTSIQHGTRLLHDSSNGQSEPYFPLPTRFGAWLTWGTAVIGLATLAAASISARSAAGHLPTLSEVATLEPARSILGSGLCVFAFAALVASWAYGHALELRLQAASAAGAPLGRFAFRSGALACAAVFVAGCAMQTGAVAPGAWPYLLAAAATLGIVHVTAVTAHVRAHEQALVRNGRDLAHLRLKGAIVAAIYAAAVCRLAIPLIWPGAPELLSVLLEDLVFGFCCLFVGTLANELRHFSLQLQPVIVL